MDAATMHELMEGLGFLAACALAGFVIYTIHKATEP